jgi:hypothetical protein
MLPGDAQFFLKHGIAMLELLMKSKLRVALLVGCAALLAMELLRGGGEPPLPPLDTSPPDPNGPPRIRIGQARSVMEQPKRDKSLDGLLKRD